MRLIGKRIEILDKKVARWVNDDFWSSVLGGGFGVCWYFVVGVLVLVFWCWYWYFGVGVGVGIGILVLGACFWGLVIGVLDLGFE
ncbi:MAG: hypothetical protein COB51_05485 [Moraxellaceae bacterium]|nr:MAG: hypothetical protein COB51_05485 [Moraxellaceae bacterium]